MPFSPTDLYLASGTASSFNTWIPNITKFDSSTFYNWEQDNVPLYDAEDRDSLLWDRTGYPIANGFSGIPGKMFCVSADAPFAGESSGIIFKSLSGVINILPNPITYPIIIEVASFGNLGELNLNNIRVAESCPGAGLEIVNRNFARTTVSATASAKWNTSSVSSLDIRNIFHDSSALCTSTTVASGAIDARWSTTNRSWVSQLSYAVAATITDRPIISINAASFDQGLGTNEYAVTEYGSTVDQTISTYDVSSYNIITGSLLQRPTISSGKQVVGLFFGNYLTGAKIYGCKGPIYIRNFCVDSASGSGGTLAHTRDTGFDIVESKIVIENCMAIRCAKNGFRVVDSELEIRRSLVAGRNYTLSSTPTARDSSAVGNGLLAVNSHIFVAQYGTLTGANLFLQFAFNDVGINLKNSTFTGGDRARITNINGDTTFVQCFYNTLAGINAENSIVAHEGRLELVNNNNGLIAVNSKVLLPSVTVENNKTHGLRLQNSVVRYNPFLKLFTAGTKYQNGSVTYEQFHFLGNGQHIVAKGSQIIPTVAEGMPSLYGKTVFTSSMGVDSVNTTMLPAIEVLDQSYVELVHASVESNQTVTDFGYTNPIFGVSMAVLNGSTAKFRGATNPTILLGPAFYAGQKKTANVYAGRNSNVEFHGNTLIGQTAVGVLVEDNSTASFTPHRSSSKVIDIDNWLLSSVDNHTRVEVHANKACLVAKDNSLIEMDDLGSYRTMWPASLVSANDYNNSDAYGISQYTSAGYFQFYPNAIDQALVETSANRYDLRANSTSITYSSPSRRYFITDYSVTSSPNDILKVSTGGMCVRALGGSKVKVNNVHFPTGWHNTSANLFDSSSGNCELLRIWNIADTSKLEAAYMSVSGVYPSLAGYYGPCSVYVSGAGITGRGAPVGTPDTGNLSVLDAYGTSGGVAGTNYGPFRLYFSPGDRAKMLGYVSGTGGIIYGAPYQHLAQGYNPSNSLIGDSAFSGIYSGITTSSFYYTSAIMDGGFKNRVLLDESAANSFANARHCSQARSGRVALVTIYRATSEPGGHGYSSNVGGSGKGFYSANLFDLRKEV